MNRWIHDIENYPNFFCVTFKNYDTKEIRYFEISERKNDVKELVNFIKTIHYLISFNGIHYDDPHLFLLVKYENNDYKSLNDKLYELTVKIIEEDDYDFYKQYKYVPRNLKLVQIDLFLYWSKMLRISKMLSLKSLAVQMNFPNIQELPIKPGSILTYDEMDLIKKYNLNDVEVTEELLKRLKDEVNLRLNIQKEYSLKCLSRDAVNIGSDLFLKLYCSETNKNIKVTRDLRTFRKSVDLKSIIFDNISFKKGNEEFEYKQTGNKTKIYCKSFYGLLKLLKTKTVYSTNELNYTVIYKDVKYDFGSGGIHAIGTKNIYDSNDNYTIVDADVGSYYPAIICNYNLYPQHLGLEWTNVYNNLRLERIQAKKTNPLKASVYKLVLNGTYGLLNNKYSWLFDWMVTLSVTINGQLMLAMLAERLCEAGIEVYTLNTDGLSSYVSNDLLDKYYEICKQWELETKMVLEYEEYKSTVMMNVNNYIWVKEDKKFKTKGSFVTKPELGNSSDNLVIPKALSAYFVQNIQPEEFIKNHNNIFDFCSAPKVNKSYTVYWNNKIQQRLNRFYVSKKGAYLYKLKEDKDTMDNMLVGYAVQLYNQHVDKPMEEYEINYDYYIAKVREIINKLEPKQMTLF